MQRSPSLSVQEANRLWQAALGHLQLRVTRPSYETWLKGTVGVSFLEGQFVIGTPSTFVSEMLEQRMYSLISQSLCSVVAGPVDLRFEVLPAGDGSAGGPNPAPPASAAVPVANPPEKVNGDLSSRRLLDTGAASLNPRYTFESFIVGKSNELAHAAALAVSERPGLTYNPLFIYSGVGLGKTHLMHAIGHRFAATGLSLIYTTTEEFTNQYIRAIRDGTTEEFRSRYRSADVLLLDDIQFIIGKEQTQEGFFHTFNTLHMAARQIVLTSDRPTPELGLLEDRVVSRLSGGLVVDIQHPDLETRLAILRAKADDSGQDFPQEVLQFLAERIHNNVRELEGNLNRVAAYAQLTGGAISIDLVKTALADTLNPRSDRKLSAELVINTVASYFSTDEETLKGRRRDKQTALARQVAMYLLREEASLPLAAIGRILGGKDHTTVLHACQRITHRTNTDPHLRRDVINIRGALSKG